MANRHGQHREKLYVIHRGHDWLPGKDGQASRVPHNKPRTEQILGQSVADKATKFETWRCARAASSALSLALAAGSESSGVS